MRGRARGAGWILQVAAVVGIIRTLVEHKVLRPAFPQTPVLDAKKGPSLLAPLGLKEDPAKQL